MRKTRIQRLDGKKVDVVLHLGNVFVCSHGLCCGKAERGYGPDLRELHQMEWHRRKLGKTVYLTQSGCLGLCALGNTVLLIFQGHPLWFHSFNTVEQVSALYDYIEAMVIAKQCLPVPDTLRDSVLEKGLEKGALRDMTSLVAPLEEPSGSKICACE
ncbi:hypothetical protein KDH_36850 [Dictyobacter sp. S3.2.2.5]|uniref:Ferredoxin n=1 Tax=Dictyobacter halimunensis TaxID=3026934 RepID=A0ABQ6FVL3_9CHLR|nr:hypothetical protein KDH_36850 [Dictyobacter sp. S3.2.2.5]